MLTDLRLLASLPPPSVSAPGASPRGVKRSRSPDQYVELPVGAEHDDGASVLSVRTQVEKGARNETKGMGKNEGPRLKREN